MGTVVPSARIVILCVRVASCRTSIPHTRIAVCRSHRLICGSHRSKREDRRSMCARIASCRRIVLHTTIVICRRHRRLQEASFQRENCHSMHESCCLQDNRSKRENCCLREPSSFAGGIVPSARIVILCARCRGFGLLGIFAKLCLNGNL